MWGWLWLLMSVAAAKSQLIVTADRPCVVVVNLKPYPLQAGSAKLVLDFPDGKEGQQRMMIRSVLGKEMWSGTVDVPQGKKVHGEWISQRMVFGPPIALDRPKLSDKGLYNVDGGWEYRDRPPPVGADTPQVEAVDRGDLVLDAIGEASGADDVGGVAREEQPVDRPAAGSPGVLALHNRTTSWANLVVDGQKVEFRGERRKEMPVGSGPHRVEVRDFHEELVYAGTVWIGAEQTVELHFSETAPPAVPGDPTAWEGSSEEEAP
jgi:hypothetical protein